MNTYTQTPAPATKTAADSGAPQAKSWRDFLPIHPAAELFPRMSEAQLATVAKDIKVNGLKIPIVLWVPGSKDDYPNDSDPPRFALDGINRLDAMERAGLQLIDEHEPTDPFTSLFYAHAITKYESDTDPYAYVISANIHRRHLTAEQKRELIAKLIEADPSKSDRQIAETVKASPTPVGTVCAKMEAKGDVSNLDTRRDTKGRQQPAHRTTSAPSEAKSHKIKFTLERIAQIKNLIERGMSREEIAEIIGVTVGSLQVTCSRLGLSLRRPRLAMTTTPPSSRDSGATETRKSDDIGPKSASEVERLRAHNEELENEVRKPEGEGESEGEGEGEGEGSELGNLLRAWDCASQGAREKFKAHVGLVAVEPPAKAMDDGLDIPEFLRRAAP